MTHDDVLHVLKKGLNTEVWGQRFYKQAAARTRAVDGQRVFESLVDEEGKHIAILRQEYAKLTGKELSLAETLAMADSVSPTEIFPQAQAADRLIPPETTDEQALEMAMEFERRGFELYEAQAKKATSPAERRMWEFLAKAENAHYTFLQETHEYLTTNGVWYFDEQEFPIFYD